MCEMFKRGVAFVAVSPVQEAWPQWLSVQVKEAWPQWLSVTVNRYYMQHEANIL